MTDVRSPDDMTVRERINEVGELLSTAWRRLRAKREVSGKSLGVGGELPPHAPSSTGAHRGAAGGFGRATG